MFDCFVCLFVCHGTPIVLWWTPPLLRMDLRYPNLKAGRGDPGQDQETDPTPKGTRGICRVGDLRFACGLIYAPSLCTRRPRGRQILMRRCWQASWWNTRSAFTVCSCRCPCTRGLPGAPAMAAVKGKAAAGRPPAEATARRLPTVQHRLRCGG